VTEIHTYCPSHPTLTSSCTVYRAHKALALVGHL